VNSPALGGGGCVEGTDGIHPSQVGITESWRPTRFTGKNLLRAALDHGARRPQLLRRSHSSLVFEGGGKTSRKSVASSSVAQQINHGG